MAFIFGGLHGVFPTKTFGKADHCILTPKELVLAWGSVRMDQFDAVLEENNLAKALHEYEQI